MTTDNRTNEPTPEQVEAAAKAFYETPLGLTNWDRMADVDPGLARRYREAMARALVATQGAALQDPERIMLHYPDGTPKSNDNIRAEAAAMREGAATHAESEPKSSYISPHLPAQIRGLYRADLREKSIQTMLDLAGDLVQELIDLRAAPVLPSSGVDEDKLAEVIESSAAKWGDTDRVQSVLAQYIARAVAEWLKGQGNAARG